MCFDGVLNGKYFTCDEIYFSLNMLPEKLTHCCAVRDIPCIESPFVGGKFPADKYFSSSKKLLEGINNNSGPCIGCNYIKEKSEQREFEGFRQIGIGNYRKCNLKCYYCVYSGDKDEFVYDPIPTLVDLLENNLIHKDCRIVIAGGEPAFYPHLVPVLDFVEASNFGLHVMTNANVWLEPVANAVDRRKKAGKYAQFTISLDSGCALSYKAVTGFDLFDQTVENIRKYSSIGNVVLKYIINSRASTPDDLSGFLGVVKNVVPFKVMIAIEHDDYTNNIEDYRKLFPFAMQLNKLLLDNGSNVDYMSWSLADAKELFDSDYAIPYRYKEKKT